MGARRCRTTEPPRRHPAGTQAAGWDVLAGGPGDALRYLLRCANALLAQLQSPGPPRLRIGVSNNPGAASFNGVAQRSSSANHPPVGGGQFLGGRQCLAKLIMKMPLGLGGVLHGKPPHEGLQL